jgi:hypothetical protein
VLGHPWSAVILVIEGRISWCHHNKNVLVCLLVDRGDVCEKKLASKNLVRLRYCTYEYARGRLHINKSRSVPTTAGVITAFELTWPSAI